MTVSKGGGSVRGKFIVIEGLDGSGKSTHIGLLADFLKSRSVAVHTTAEPTEGYVGRHLREMLANSENKDMCLQSALFLADRLDHVTHPTEGINAYLDRGITVISDRYYYSSFAYQGTATDIDWVMDMNLNCPKILTPDLCIFLDVDPQVCQNRIKAERANLELYERDVEIMNEVRKNFYIVFGRLASRENISIINANRDVSEISKDILDVAEAIY